MALNQNSSSGPIGDPTRVVEVVEQLLLALSQKSATGKLNRNLQLG